ncbi:MAG: hypothetical protein RL097_616 [Candidatus Parcubacteria bacterium]|jgi:hypothetical protein
MDSNNRKIIVLVAVIVVILVAVFIFTLNQLLRPDETASDPTVVPFPDSEVRTDIAPVTSNEAGAPAATTSTPFSSNDVVSEATEANSVLVTSESDWREQVVTYGSPVQSGSGVVNQVPATPAPVQSGSPYSVDDLVANGLVLDYNSYNWAYPTSYDMGNGTVISADDLENADSFAAAISPFDSAVETFAEAQSCGVLRLPSSVSALEKFIREIDTEDQVICMGEAIANDCESAKLVAAGSEGDKYYIYVGEREDGVCSVGSTSEEAYVSLCALEAVMDENTNNNYSLTKWLSIFDDEPGESFASLFSTETGLITGSDCVMTKVR